MESLHIFGKSSLLHREPSAQTITQTSCNFSPQLMFEFGGIRRCLASLEKSIGEFSMVYKK